MPIQLPPPIEQYVKADNSGEVEALSQCFASYATVRDEKRSPATLEFAFALEGGKITSLEIH